MGICLDKGLSDKASMNENTSSILTDGHYKVTGSWYRLICVKGESAVMKGTPMGDMVMHIKYGDFGAAGENFCETTGHSNYNLQLTYNAHEQEFKELGVITDDGVKMTTTGMMGIAVFEWVTDEEAAAWADDGDPVEAPPAPYTIQPEYQGRCLWFTGPPGTGKSTTAQLLARNNGYVYYEADCFSSCQNPYVPVDAPDPSMAQTNQRQLKGEGLEQRKEASQKLMNEFNGFLKGDYDKEVFKDLFVLMSEDIKRERARIGGDWAIANVVATQELRECIRSVLGPDLVFVLLEMELEDQVDRIQKRHHGDETTIEMMKDIFNICEPAGDTEENVVTVKVTKDMSPEDVVKKTIEML